MTATPSPAPLERGEARRLARTAMGFTGESGAPRLREALTRAGVGWYPMAALGALVMVDGFQGYAFTVLAPEIAATFGLGTEAVVAMGQVRILAIVLAALPAAALVQRRPRRALVSVATALAWSLATALTGLATGAASLLGFLVADGVSTGAVRAVHPPLLVDAYPPEVRVRVLSGYQAADGFGNILAPLAVAALSAVAHLTWRGVFLVLGAASLLVACSSFGLRDPGFGRWDSIRARRALGRRSDPQPASNPAGDLPGEAVDLGFFEIVRRLLLIPTVARVLVANAVRGIFIVPLAAYLSFFLDERWNLGVGARGLFFAQLPVYSLLALAVSAPKTEALFRRDPAGVVRLAAGLIAVAIVLVAGAVASPSFVGMVVLFGAAFAAVAVLGPALQVTVLSIVPPGMRAHAAALSGIFVAGVGGGAGLLLLTGLDRRFGTGPAIASLAIPGVIGAIVLWSAASTVDRDLDRMVDELVENEELRSLEGGAVPLLTARHLDFSYGSRQVLFDVSLTVRDGEMAALLGTNGAGKSTLLRVLAGLGLPSRGTVRFRGRDITYLDPERRLGLGIVHVPAGHATFAPLTVVENLRVFAYSHGRHPAAVERGLDEAFSAFPALAERRNQLASSLSGGERQMLGLARALVLPPRLLLADELSLGLAPKVVADLMEMVRRIHAAGSAVLLVEQSLHLALSLAAHAWFLEKGRVRFDGPATELAERPDLLRSIFFDGAASRPAGEGPRT